MVFPSTKAAEKHRWLLGHAGVHRRLQAATVDGETPGPQNHPHLGGPVDLVSRLIGRGKGVWEKGWSCFQDGFHIYFYL